MGSLPPRGHTWLVTLECQGSIPGPSHLNGNTLTGGLDLVEEPDVSGTRWAITAMSGGVYFLRCLGHFESPTPRTTPRILDGRTLDATVGLVPDHPYLLSGARWEGVEVASGIVTLRCLGHIEGKGARLLDGNTKTASVQLAPDESLSGTRWRVTALGSLVTLECLDKTPGGARYLKGEGHGAVRLDHTVTDSLATLWQMNETDDTVTLTCIGDTGSDRVLDGHTLDATVGLAPSSEGQFTGTRWVRAEIGSGVSTLHCLGSAEGLGRRFLSGNPGEGTVALAATAEPRTGTDWRIKRAGYWWIPCRSTVSNPPGPIQHVSTTRIGQLTGTDDPQGRPLLSCKTDRWGVQGADLGANAYRPKDERLYIFFGDVPAWDRDGGPDHDADYVAWTDATSVDELVQRGPGTGPQDCALRPVLDRRGKFFDPFRIGPPPHLSGVFSPEGTDIGTLGTEETPIGAFSFDGRMYVFVWIGPGNKVNAGIPPRQQARPVHCRQL
jgi:hypothetical protein